MITFNHERFIAQAINSALEQKTTFTVEIVISDDCSTDKTGEIIKEFAQKYPDKIRAELHDKNLGASNNALYTLSMCYGEYIALLEGDDYWTDPFKLQKQIDFLEANKSYSLCTHLFKTYDDENMIWGKDIYPKSFDTNEKWKDISIDTMFKPWLTQTLTMVFRKDMFEFHAINKYAMFGDVHLIYLLLLKGSGRCLNFVGGVYRMHNNGIMSKQSLIAKAEFTTKVYKDLYEIHRSGAFKVKYIENYSHYIELAIRSPSKKPFLDKCLIYDIFKLFLLSFSITILFKKAA